MECEEANIAHAVVLIKNEPKSFLFKNSDPNRPEIRIIKNRATSKQNHIFKRFEEFKPWQPNITQQEIKELFKNELGREPNFNILKQTETIFDFGLLLKLNKK